MNQQQPETDILNVETPFTWLDRILFHDDPPQGETLRGETLLETAFPEFKKSLTSLERKSDKTPTDLCDLTSLHWLRDRFEDILHDLRLLSHFSAWIRGKARERLFHRCCRHVLPEEWQYYVADAKKIPWIFGAIEGSPAKHLRHCPYCRLQTRLAEGRLRQVALGSDCVGLGDAWFHHLVTGICGQAMAAGMGPVADNLSLVWNPEAFGHIPAPLLKLGPVIRPGESQKEIRVSAVLSGDPQLGIVELLVTAEFVPSGVDPDPSGDAVQSMIVFPNRSQARPEVDLSERGEARLQLLLPDSKKAGRCLIRYAARRLHGRALLPGLDQWSYQGGALGDHPEFRSVAPPSQRGHLPAVPADVGTLVLELET